MHRAAVSPLKVLKQYGLRSWVFRASERFASTEVEKRSSSGFFSWLTGEKSYQLPPLDYPLPAVTLPPPLPDYVEPGKTKITTLPNGIKIASETSPNPAASIGLYVDCGSVYESPNSFGVTHLLERLAFKSTTNRSHLRIVREVEAIGGNVSASASREQMGYTYDALKTYVPEMVEVLIDSVINPVFLDWEVNEQVKKVKTEIAEASNNPQGLLLEAIHSVGYCGALAIPLLASESSLNYLNSSVLEQFVTENYTAPRMVLAASGVEHEELIKLTEPLLSNLPKVNSPEDPKSIYVGGDYRCQADSMSTHLALAFEVPGGWHNEKDAMAVTVLQMLMGGGGSFSAGGPGKGMYSRLYLRVLNEFQQIQSFSAFNSIYNNTGIFGIHATTITKRRERYPPHLASTHITQTMFLLPTIGLNPTSPILGHVSSNATDVVEGAHLGALARLGSSQIFLGTFLDQFRSTLEQFDPIGLQFNRYNLSQSSDFVSKAVDLAARELLAVATPGQVNQIELDRAKQATKSAVLMNLESRMVASEDIGRQILTYGERKPIDHFIKAVDEVTLQDIASLSEKIISSPLTMATWGDVIHVPSYESVSRLFNSK